MKNYKQLIQALLDGKTLVNNTSKLQINLDTQGRIQFRDNMEFKVLAAEQVVSIIPSNWAIYEEYHWYNNIPATGILCWVSSTFRKEKEKIIRISNFHSKADYPYDLLYRYATPLKTEEIGGFYESAMKIEESEQRIKK